MKAYLVGYDRVKYRRDSKPMSDLFQVIFAVGQKGEPMLRREDCEALVFYAAFMGREVAKGADAGSAGETSGCYYYVHDN